MAAFKVANARVFHALGSQRLDPEDAFQILTDLLGKKHVDWWFTLFLTGGGLKVGAKVSAEEVMTKVGIIEAGQESARLTHLGQWHDGWGNSARRFIQIHEKIEHIAQWN